MITIITATSLSKFLACQRAYYYRHELRLNAIETAEALSFGRAFHAAMESRNKGMTCEQALAEGMIHIAGNEQAAATLSGLVYGYFARYKDDPPIETRSEIQFSHKIGKNGFRAAGVIDGLAQNSAGEFVLLEYKTTSQSVDPSSDYWARLRSNLQVNMYVDACLAHGIEVSKVIYDVTKKPSIRPRQEETLEAYALRLREDCEKRPEFYFARREVTILHDDLHAFRTMRKEACYQIVSLRHRSRRTGRVCSPWLCCGQQQTCNFCEYNSFCLYGAEASTQNIPSGFYLGERNPELKQNSNI
ncbi:MAG: hypothetical protein EOM51_10965 [Clostridia bacterium]|nr:hypothetical protein [Clostridia bacterium]